MDVKMERNGSAEQEIQSLKASPKQLSQSPFSNGSTSSSLKGQGLRKWRRVKREINKDENSPTIDFSKILKRGLSTSIPAKNFDQTNQPNSLKDEPYIQPSEPNLLEAMASTEAGIHSESSNENSSESSVASSINKSYAIGFNLGREENLGVKFMQINKKVRGGQEMKSQKDDNSAVEESESICSNVIESQGHDNQDEGITGEDNVRESRDKDEETSRNDQQGDSSEGGIDHTLPPGQSEDLFAEPLRLLQATRETLEKEIKRLEEINKEPVSCPRHEEEGGSEREMEELEALYTKSMEGEIRCLLLSEAVEKERRAMREETALMDMQLEKVTESCTRLQRVEELLGFHNGICKTSLYWLAQLGLLFLAVAVLGLQIFSPSIGGGGDVPT